MSIQGLVLVPLPYFNEAGYEKQARACAPCPHGTLLGAGTSVLGTCSRAWRLSLR